MMKLDRIAAFGDELRDGVKGHYAHQTEPGFASGQPGLEESVKFGIVAATPHPQLDYAKVNYSKAPWASAPRPGHQLRGLPRRPGALGQAHGIEPRRHRGPAD